MPAVRSSISFVHNQRAGSALPGRFFKFVGPATVIGHRIAGEQFWILGRKTRIVDKHHHGFAFDIQTFIVIPVVFRCDNAVTNKHQFRVFDLAEFSDTGGPGKHLVTIFKRRRRFIATEAHRRHFFRINLHQLYRLNVSAVRLWF